MAAFQSVDEKVIVSIFVAVESVAIFSATMPSIFTIDTFAGDPRALAKLRQGEVIAAGYSALLTTVASVLLKTTLPLIFGLAAILSMIFIYESAIRGARMVPSGPMASNRAAPSGPLLWGLGTVNFRSPDTPAVATALNPGRFFGG